MQHHLATRLLAILLELAEDRCCRFGFDGECFPTGFAGLRIGLIARAAAHTCLGGWSDYFACGTILLVHVKAAARAFPAFFAASV